VVELFVLASRFAKLMMYQHLAYHLLLHHHLFLFLLEHL
jgi:hypothetical protein